eukprot:s6668_g8.t1
MLKKVCLSLGIQLIWTTDFQQALTTLAREKDKTVMTSTRNKFGQLLTDLIQVCLQGDLSKLRRIKYETLVTIHVHQKDLFMEVMKKPKDMKVKDENDFEWLKQTRMYWRTENDHAVISIADVDFIYSYEYLGCKERTRPKERGDLRAAEDVAARERKSDETASKRANASEPEAGHHGLDRPMLLDAVTSFGHVLRRRASWTQLLLTCFRINQSPFFSPAAAAAEDMGRTLGIFVVVTNCSDQHRFKDMAKIFKGLCAALGALAWQLCFPQLRSLRHIPVEQGTQFWESSVVTKL